MKRRLGRLGRIAALTLVVVWSLFPVYWALKTSLSTNVASQSTPVQWVPGHVKFTAYQALFGAGPESQDAAGGIARSLINVTVEATGATVLTLVIAVLGAYAFARLRFRLKGLLFYGVIATLMLPVYATLIPIYRIMADLGVGGHLYRDHPCLRFWLCPPCDVDNVQRLHGAASAASKRLRSSTVQLRCNRFVKSHCPWLGPGIAATAIVTFLFGWSQFIFPLVLSSSSSTQPLTVLLAAIDSRNVPYTIINAAAIIAVAIPAVIVFLLNRWIVTGITAGSVKIGAR